MLRDDRQVAIDDVIVALENASDAYSDTAELLQSRDASLATRFDTLARRRAIQAARLTEYLRAMGDLPSEPDQDMETLDVVMRHLRAQLAGPESEELVGEAIGHEQSIIDKAELAVATTPSERVVEVLAEVADEARRTLEALRSWCEDHGTSEEQGGK